MAEVTNRVGLKEYCLRQLGYPVIEINVADEQLEDRIDDAIQYFNEWHYEGTIKTYLKHQLTCSVLVLSSVVPENTFRQGDNITGGTSKATAVVWKQNADNQSLSVWQIMGTFVADEVISTVTSSANIAHENFLTLGDLDRYYLDIPDHIMSVTRIFPLSATITTNFLFDPVYYHAFDLIWNFGGLDLISYELMKERINYINQLLVGQKPIRFERYGQKLNIDLDWKRAVSPNGWVIIECYRFTQPSEAPKMWNDWFLKAYCTALFRIQWGNNLSKFAAIQLPGGVTLDGPRILEQGKLEKTELEEKAKTGMFTEPLGLYCG